MSRPDGVIRRVEKAVPFVLMLPIIGVYLLLLSTNWKPTWDSATYIMLGKSLISGHGFKYMGIPHTKYPFMFPLMLSPIIGLFGRNFLLMRLLIVLMGLESIRLTFSLFRRSYGVALGLGLMLMTAVSYPLMFECTRLLSDIPYMFLSLLSLIFVIRYGQDDRWSSKSGYIAAALILASFLTRYIGLALFAGAVVYLLLDGKGTRAIRFRKVALIGLIFLIPASAWMIRGVVVRRISPPPPDLREFLSYERELIIVNPGDPHTRTARFGDLTARVKQNGKYYQDLTADIVLGKNTDSGTRAWVIFAILLCGFIYCLVKWRSVFEYYVIFYVLAYVVWTSLQGTRFLVPIIPFIFYYLVRAVWLVPDGLSFLIKRLSKGRLRHDSYRVWGERTVLVIMVGIVIFWNWGSDVGVIRAEHAKPYYTGSIANFLDAVNWVRENTDPESVIVSGRSPWVYMLSDRRTFTPLWVEDAGEVMASIIRNEVSYVINSPALYSYKFLSLALKEMPEGFAKIHEMGDCIVYKVTLKNLDMEKYSLYNQQSLNM